MKLWEKGNTLDSIVEDYTVDNDCILDRKLIEYDCTASISHAKTLYKSGIITITEADDLETALKEIIQLSKTGEFIILKEDEDCHTAIEKYLVEKLGAAGRKIHTARSRNDQVLTALRLFYIDEINKCNDLAQDYISGLKDLVTRYGSIKFPGYTHTRKAMPSSVQLWAGAYIDSMQDNIEFLDSAKDMIDRSPAGTGAGYGIPIDIDNEYTKELLGFKRIHHNPLHAQLSRGKYEMFMLHCLKQIMFDINRLASDLIFYSIPEIGYIILPDELCTGSSIMPQKKNPDLLELMRGYYHVVNSLELRVNTVSSNLLSGYNRDIQLTKEPVMRGFEISQKSLRISGHLLEKLIVDENRCDEAMTDEIFAAEKAYKLVLNGVPFREAYRMIAEGCTNSK